MSGASNPAQWTGEATFEYGGEQYTITFDNMALLEAEDAIGISLPDWLPQLYAAIKAGRNPLMKHMVALVYGGIKVNHPEITPKRVVDMAMAEDQGMIGAVKQALVSIEIPEEAMAQEEAGNVPAAPVNRRQRKAGAKKAGAGTRSTARGAKQASSRKTSGSKP